MYKCNILGNKKYIIFEVVLWMIEDGKLFEKSFKEKDKCSLFCSAGNLFKN